MTSSSILCQIGVLRTQHRPEPTPRRPARQPTPRTDLSDRRIRRERVAHRRAGTAGRASPVDTIRYYQREGLLPTGERVRALDALRRPRTSSASSASAPCRRAASRSRRSARSSTTTVRSTGSSPAATGRASSQSPGAKRKRGERGSRKASGSDGAAAPHSSSSNDAGVVVCRTLVSLAHLVLAAAVRLADGSTGGACSSGAPPSCSWLVARSGRSGRVHAARRSAARIRALRARGFAAISSAVGVSDGTRQEPQLGGSAADNDRDLGGTDAATPLGGEEALDDAVLQGVVVEDHEATTGTEQVERGRKPGFERVELPR